MAVGVRCYARYARSSHVSLKVLQCVLFVFFNRAQRVLRNGSFLVSSLDLRGTAVLPLVVSAVLHTAILCPGLVVPTRRGRIAVLCTLLHVMLLYMLAGLLVASALDRYVTTASFLSVLVASHLCLVVRPIESDLVPAQKVSYGHLMDIAAYALPVVSWVLLPVLQVHELEAIALLYVPEVLCFVFAYIMQFVTLLLNVAVDAACSVCGAVGYVKLD
ncbi:hypothetical protein T484DRAFT_1755659 [Baffinella frigidus]|nr:hypothetical protein T484DRAFT_1755659 [Cryptophyta sp. CCMP2293]